MQRLQVSFFYTCARETVKYVQDKCADKQIQNINTVAYKKPFMECSPGSDREGDREGGGDREGPE